MKLARRVEIQPTPAQEQKLLQAAGNARWAWNWGLRRKIDAWDARKAALEAGVAKEKAPRVPTAIDLHRDLNALKKQDHDAGGVPWMYLVSKAAPQESLRDLDRAFQHFFRRVRAGEKAGFPRFKSRSRGPGGFRLTGAISADERAVTLPTIGRVRLKPGERGRIPAGRYAQVSLRAEAGRWFASVLGPETLAGPPNGGAAVGVDLGVARLATTSDGEVIPNPKALARHTRQLRRVQQVVSRRQKGSRRRDKAKVRLARVHRRIKNIRRDATHKATTRLAKSHGTVVIEDLRVGNMTRKAKGVGRQAKAGLNRSILDAGFYEFRRQLEYKCPLYGSSLVAVPPHYTSQRCRSCGHVAAANRPTQARFDCVACGHRDHADRNAAINILVAGSCPETQNARRGDVSPPVASAAAGGSHR